jgi:ATP-dependent Clp protease ATP-binding subunit ClpC
MFERFTDRARAVVVLAQEEANAHNRDFIDTEHILLGFLLEGEGVAAQALAALGITPQALRQQVEEITSHGRKPPAANTTATQD